MEKPLFRRSDANRGRSRLAGIVLAGAVNLGIVAAFLFSVHVAPIVIPATPLMIAIDKHVEPPPPLLTMTPTLRQPQTIAMPAPQFTIQPDAPSVAAPAPAAGPAPSAAASAPAPASSPPGIVDPAYLALIRLHLLKYLNDLGLGKDDPAVGIVTMRFVIDRTGRVLSFAIGQSSGHASLDNDGLILIQKASPLPPMPANVPGERLGLEIPVDFKKNADAEPSFSRNGFRR